MRSYTLQSRHSMIDTSLRSPCDIVEPRFAQPVDDATYLVQPRSMVMLLTAKRAKGRHFQESHSAT